MLELRYTAKFKKDYRRIKKQGKDTEKLAEALKMLRSGEELPAAMQDHCLVGNYKDHRECHIESDWLLIYRIEHDRLILTATRTGSHSELFDE